MGSKKQLKHLKRWKIWAFLVGGSLTILFIAMTVVVCIKKIDQNASNDASHETFITEDKSSILIDYSDATEDETKTEIEEATEENAENTTSNSQSTNSSSGASNKNTNPVTKNNKKQSTSNRTENPDTPTKNNQETNNQENSKPQEKEESNNQTPQIIPVESIRIKEYPKQHGVPLYGDDEADIELSVLPANATYDSSEIEWSIGTYGEDERCARIINGKPHIIAKYCTQSPSVRATLQDKYDGRTIPVEQTIAVYQTFKNTSMPCDNIKQNSTCFYETGDRVGFSTNLDSVIWTITDEHRGGVVPEFSVYAQYSGIADGVSGSISKVQVKSMHSPQSLTFYIKIK